MTWEVFVTVRLGSYRLKEVNVTPALGMAAIALFFAFEFGFWR